MIPAVIYAAKSSEDIHGSLPDQIKLAHQVIAREGATLLSETDVFPDEAFSGYSGPRGPALAAALARAEQLAKEYGECIVAVWRADRLARGDGTKAPHLLSYVLWGRLAKVRFASWLDPQAFNPDSLVVTAASGDQAHGESKLKSGSIPGGKRRRKTERKLHNPGRWDKLGYDTPRDETGRAVRGVPRTINRAGARIVRRIYQDGFAYLSHNQIARNLREDGVPTVAGGKWSQSMVSMVLRDPYYAGHFLVDGELFEGLHEPIVTLDEWRRMQAITRDRTTKGDGRPGRASKVPHLFTHRHLRCGECGAPMGFRHKPGKKTGWADSNVYVCNGRKSENAGRRCGMTPVDAPALDAMFLDQLKDDPALLADRVREALAGMLTARNEAVDRHADAERELLKLADRRTRLERDYENGDLPAKLYARQDEKLAEQTAATNAQVEQLARRVDELETVTPADVETAAKRLLASITSALENTTQVETARNIIRQAWPTITVHRDGAAVRLETPEVSPEFARALGATNKDSMNMLRLFVEPHATAAT